MTVDDDILYPRPGSTGLWDGRPAHPTDIHCTAPVSSGWTATGWLRTPRGSGAGTRWPAWPDLRPASRGCGIPRPCWRRSAAGDRIPQHAPRADDIWLHRVALRSDIRVRQLSRVPEALPLHPGHPALTLAQENVDEGGNDRLTANLYEAVDIAALTPGPVRGGLCHVRHGSHGGAC